MPSNKSLKLFCLPYAGGSSHVFFKWKEFVEDHIELIPIELTGRGRRFNDPLYNNVAEAVDDVIQQIMPNLGGKFSFFGHSLGAMLAYEVAQKLITVQNKAPVHLFFSGREAPGTSSDKDRNYHLLSDEAFKEKIWSLGGTPREFFDNEEMLALYLPVLKNDFKLADENLARAGRAPFECPISVCVGKEEDLYSHQIHAWRHHTNDRCTVHYFNGGHFFINEAQSEIITLINKALKSEVSTKTTMV